MIFFVLFLCVLNKCLVSQNGEMNGHIFFSHLYNIKFLHQISTTFCSSILKLSAEYPRSSIVVVCTDIRYSSTQ